MEESEVVERFLGHMGRMLSGSKGAYANAHPTHRVFFNGNVYDGSGRKLWYGDVDLTKDDKVLHGLASELGTVLYVTREMPFRFEQPTVQQLESACSGEFPSAVRIDP